MVLEIILGWSAIFCWLIIWTPATENAAKKNPQFWPQATVGALFLIAAVIAFK